MAKKKKAHKKHYPKSPSSYPAPSEDESVEANPTSTINRTKVEPSIARPQLAPTQVLLFDPGIRRDVLRTIVLAGSLALLQLVLWLLMTHSSLGSTIYSWVKI